MATRMLQRRGTAAEWAAMNPVLAEGEIGYEIDTRIMKIGDGVTEWIDLSLSALTKSATIMQGPLTLLAPTEDNHAARLKDVTDAIASFPVDSSPPIGAVLMYSGSIASLPSSWKLCDGTNGTPDLRDRFIVGAEGAYDQGDTGGADDVTLTTAQMPGHNHSGPSHSHSTPNHSHSSGSLSAGSAGAHTHGLQYTSVSLASPGTSRIIPNDSGALTANSVINSSGAHTHSISGSTSSTNGGDTGESGTGNTGNAGGGEAHENRPPYYALAYIMRVA